MHRTTSSVIAFAATIAAAVQAVALISWKEPADDPASTVAALAPVHAALAQAGTHHP